MNQPVEPADMPQIVPVSAPVGAEPPIVARSPSAVVRLLGVLKREPVMFLTLAYLFVSFLGLWSSYWFYRRFDVPILEYMQSSDFFVAGLRRPEFVLLLLYTLFWGWVATWPLRWIEKNPERARKYREKHRWGSLFFPRANSWQSLWGMSSETGLVSGFLVMMIWLLFQISDSRAARIHAGKDGDRVRVTLANDQALAGDTRLLGTSSAFVFLWHPENRKNEVIPVESILRIEFLHPDPAKPAMTAP